MQPADALLAHWDVAPTSIAPADGGMNSRTWWVDLAGSAYVAKWVPEAEARYLRAGVVAASLAGADGLLTGRPLPRSDGSLWASTDDGCLVVLEIVPGRELTGDDDGDQERIGATLARAHRLTVGRRAEGAWEQFWVDPDAAHLAADPEVREAVRAAVAGVTTLEGLTTGIGQGDPAPEAFLADGAATGLIDWGSAVNGPLLHDLASAAMYLGGLEAAAPMLAAYDAAGGPVPAYEVDAHAAAFLAWRWAVQADYFAGRLAAEDSEENRKGFADARRHLVPA